MLRRIACLAWTLAALHGASAHADPQRRSTATAGGVRLAGEARASSTGMRREPGYVLTNLTASPRVVELVALASLGRGEPPRALAIQGARRIVLAPHATRALLVEFTGQPINLGGGLSYYRFTLTVDTGGHRMTAIASNAYICRMPLRRYPATLDLSVRHPGGVGQMSAR